MFYKNEVGNFFRKIGNFSKNNNIFVSIFFIKTSKTTTTFYLKKFFSKKLDGVDGDLRLHKQFLLQLPLPPPLVSQIILKKLFYFIPSKCLKKH